MSDIERTPNGSATATIFARWTPFNVARASSFFLYSTMLSPSSNHMGICQECERMSCERRSASFLSFRIMVNGIGRWTEHNNNEHDYPACKSGEKFCVTFVMPFL